MEGVLFDACLVPFTLPITCSQSVDFGILYLRDAWCYDVLYMEKVRMSHIIWNLSICKDTSNSISMKKIGLILYTA